MIDKEVFGYFALMIFGLGTSIAWELRKLNGKFDLFLLKLEHMKNIEKESYVVLKEIRNAINKFSKSD